VSILEFPEARLLVFIKAPVPGQVKTRLIKHLGEIGAARLYQTLVRRTLNIAMAAQLCPVQLWCAPNTKQAFFVACRRRYQMPLYVQQGSDLGERMDRALTAALRDGDYAVLIGGDCPSLGTGALQCALKALANGEDAVLGPVEDGGYVLIGLRRPCAALFNGVAWSGKGVLAATRRRLRRAGLRWVELPLGWDVDRPADVRRLKQTHTFCAKKGKSAGWSVGRSSGKSKSFLDF
jgi:rSAM/selenodomain-associated transferase 1